METVVAKKRKRQADPPRITFNTPSKTFERLFKESSLEALHSTVIKKLGLGVETRIEFSQVRNGRIIDLEDEDDFDALKSYAISSGVAEVKVNIQNATGATSRLPEPANTETATQEQSNAESSAAPLPVDKKAQKKQPKGKGRSSSLSVAEVSSLDGRKDKKRKLESDDKEGTEHTKAKKRRTAEDVVSATTVIPNADAHITPETAPIISKPKRTARRRRDGQPVTDEALDSIVADVLRKHISESSRQIASTAPVTTAASSVSKPDEVDLPRPVVGLPDVTVEKSKQKSKPELEITLLAPSQNGRTRSSHAKHKASSVAPIAAESSPDDSTSFKVATRESSRFRKEGIDDFQSLILGNGEVADVGPNLLDAKSGSKIEVERSANGDANNVLANPPIPSSTIEGGSPDQSLSHVVSSATEDSDTDDDEERASIKQMQDYVSRPPLDPHRSLNYIAKCQDLFSPASTPSFALSPVTTFSSHMATRGKDDRGNDDDDDDSSSSSNTDSSGDDQSHIPKEKRAGSAVPKPRRGIKSMLSFFGSASQP